MATRYTVKQGDCISSIAFAHGLLPETIWKHSENAELKKRRGDPNVLAPGDVVVIPDKRLKEISKAAGARHRFKRKGGTETLCLRIVHDGEPRSSVPYRLELKGRTLRGTTDSDGKIEVTIPPDAKGARLFLEAADAHEEEYVLDLGHLDPVTEISGVQMRLLNLGYHFGEPHGELDLDTKEAIEEFQRDAGLEESGEIDEATRDKLVELHGG